MLRIPPAAGLTARAIPVALYNKEVRMDGPKRNKENVDLLGAWTGVLVTSAMGWTTFPDVPNTTCPVAEFSGMDADGLVRGILTGLLLTTIKPKLTLKYI